MTFKFLVLQLFIWIEIAIYDFVKRARLNEQNSTTNINLLDDKNM